MSIEEEQELIALDWIIKSGLNEFTQKQLENGIKDKTGDIMRVLLRLFDNNSIGYKSMTMADILVPHPFAKKRRNQLKWKKIWQPFRGIAFWATFVAAVVSAVFSILQYLKPDGRQHNPQQSTTVDTQGSQPQQIQKGKHDTTMRHIYPDKQK
jgi:hypothetical protein